jgi:hypothetical protein
MVLYYIPSPNLIYVIVLSIFFSVFCLMEGLINIQFPGLCLMHKQVLSIFKLIMEDYVTGKE